MQAFRLSLVSSLPWASSVRMGSWSRHTLCASISFFFTLGSHNFINGSSYHWLLLCLQVFLSPLLRDINGKFSMNLTSFFNLCLLSLFLSTPFSLDMKFHQLVVFMYYILFHSLIPFMPCNLTFTPAIIYLD